MVASAMGPAFVAAVAYVDPGNFATNFAGGIEFGYGLAWVIVLANLVATLVQYVTSKAGLATGRSLPELCRERFGRRANLALWLQAEVVAMATDLAEFVGAAVGLHLVFGMPLLPAGLLTAVVAFTILALEQQGRRRFVVAVAALLLIVAGGFGYLLFAAGTQDGGALAAGLVPQLPGDGALALIVGIVGATVMPHVIYAHSALQKPAFIADDVVERRRRLRLNRWDCIVGLSTAGAINLAMLCVAAALPVVDGATDLDSIHATLRAVAGSGAALAFGIALIASGFASASVGTYAGQVVMAGFLNRRIPLFVRRGLTMLPSLVVLGTAVDPSQALVISQIVLSFGIPFALVPLVLVTRDPRVMKEMVNRRATTVAMAVISAVISALNLYLIYDTIGG
ncbi:manganese transport protein [Cryptosporangium aurantiacum]|uniref:Manganese transport protein n=2 Tax=Cryptosporangium aurantiacum TaxID=134849 RepID=A0A1M7KGP1_9ACTN|nr:manganese transport protein [Cryptosporangium aurantiacum]